LGLSYPNLTLQQRFSNEGDILAKSDVIDGSIKLRAYLTGAVELTKYYSKYIETILDSYQCFSNLALITSVPGSPKMWPLWCGTDLKQVASMIFKN